MLCSCIKNVAGPNPKKRCDLDTQFRMFVAAPTPCPKPDICEFWSAARAGRRSLGSPIWSKKSRKCKARKKGARQREREGEKSIWVLAGAPALLHQLRFRLHLPQHSFLGATWDVRWKRRCNAGSLWLHKWIGLSIIWKLSSSFYKYSSWGKIEIPSADPEKKKKKAFPSISNKLLSGNILYATNPGASTRRLLVICNQIKTKSIALMGHICSYGGGNKGEVQFSWITSV